MDKIKIVYMGTPDFSVGALRVMAEAGMNVCGVVTQPDKAKGRSKVLQPTPVKEEALKWNMPVYQPKRVREPEFIQTLKEIAPDLIVVAAFGQIIPKEILDLPKYGCLNIHASLLPKYRGAAPIQQAILDGEKESGVTIMKMDVGLDTGDMISKVVVPIEADETGGSLFDKLSDAGAELLLKTIPDVVSGAAVYEKQPEESPTPYCRMITKDMGLLNFEKPAEELERIVRGMNPWPSAFTYLNGKTLKIWKCRVMPSSEQKVPGMIVKTDKEGIWVACGTDMLCLEEIQLEGKKRMDAGAFLRGYQIAPETILRSERS